MGLRKNTLPVISWLGLGLLGLIAYIYSNPLSGADSPGCRMSYMGPSYARIRGFDETHTRFASKYSLYLYREQDHDPAPQNDNGFESLDGIPILFIPGNAGSYRQVRSIAAETSNLYFEEYRNSDELNKNARNFDFFTADFNEDFTAFHGRTMLDQAEYLNQAIKFILGLYSNTENPPKSVVVLGHSMGGVVARVMMTLPNYLENSINTIITLSSPHAAAPLTFDGDILKLYSATDRFWYAAYNNMSELAQKRLSETSLISITGGLLDEILPADYTTLGFLVPPSHGFTVYTTGIPNVWTPIDHLAIVWCHQLRHKVAKVLLDIADFSSPSRTYSLPERLSIFKEHLLTGFEDITSQDKKIVTSDKDIQLNLDASQVTFITPGNALRINPDVKRNEKHPNFNIFQLPSNKDSHFSLISSLPMTVWKEFSKTEYINPSVLICSKTDSLKSEEIYDYTTENTAEYISLQCIDITLDQRPIPNSHTNALEDSSYGGDKLPFYGFKLNSTLLNNFDVIVVADRLKSTHHEFVLGQVSSTDSTNYILGTNSFSLITSGAQISLPNNRAIAANIKVPGAWSSLLAYDVSFKIPKSVSSSFAPIVRQWSSEPYETKWHIDIENNKRVTMTMHGIAPYTPFRKESGMNIELWNDAAGSEPIPLDIKIKIDWLTSLRLLVIRYRLALGAFCVLVTLYVLTIQLRTLQKTLKFPSFIQGLQVATSLPNFVGICLILALLTPIVKFSFVQKVLNLIDPVVLRDPNEINLALHREFKLNSFYLGLEEECLFFLGPLFYTIGIGLVYISYNILFLMGMAISQIFILSRAVFGSILKNKRFGGKDGSENQPSKSTTSISVSNDISPASILAKDKISKIQLILDIWKHRQILVIALLVLAVPFYIPYQFVYIVCCCIQAIKLIKIFVSKQDKGREIGSNRVSNLDNLLNYQFSWLILMLWILPVNIPILIVFVHNLSVNWTTPFSSHHNFLSIIPIIIVTEKNSRMTIIPRSSKTSSTLSNTMITAIIWYCYYFIFYSIIYGIRHTYWLHHLLNILCCLLLMLYYEDEQTESEKMQ